MGMEIHERGGDTRNEYWSRPGRKHQAHAGLAGRARITVQPYGLRAWGVIAPGIMARHRPDGKICVIDVHRHHPVPVYYLTPSSRNERTDHRQRRIKAPL